MERYVIEIVHYRTRTRYQIKTIIHGLVIPVNGKSYKTEEEARQAAENMGITICKTGTYYEVI